MRSYRVLAIPLGAVLVALLLMLSWGHQSSQEAEAGPLPATGVLLVAFEAKSPLDPANMLGLCVEIRDGFDLAQKGLACDGLGAGVLAGTDPEKFTTHADEDGAVDGAIQITLDVNNPFLILKGEYSLLPQTVASGQFELVGPPKRTCAFLVIETCAITYSYASTKTVIQKDPRLANLWLCNAGPCDNKSSGVEGVNLYVNLSREVGDLDPKCVGFPNFADPATCETQQIGSFEFEVRFDAKYVTVDVEPGTIFTLGSCTNGLLFNGAVGAGGVIERCVVCPGELNAAGCVVTTEAAGVCPAGAGAAGCTTEPLLDVECVTATGEGFLRFACVTKGKPINASSGPGTLAIVHVRPTADVYKLLIPNQENGIVTQLINQDCQLSDLQGHPIEVDFCENAAITIRYLEGDVHADCVIDVLDQQQVAFRWGAQLGNLLYDARYDLEPSFPKADGDIDAKDLQFVYGRHTIEPSTCKTPHPPQPPVDPQVKVGPPLVDPN